MKYLKGLRKDAGYKTAKEVATLLNISDGMMYQIEEGYKKPSVKLATKIAALYKCTLDEIFLPMITTNSDKNRRHVNE